MKNREIILWTVIVALIGGIVLYISLNNYQTAKYVSTTINSPKIGTTQSFLLSDVAKHNNQASCWTVIDGNIYDITSFVSSHPAGVQKILKGCGIDATQLYGRVGAHDITKLTDFVVGIIK